METRQIFLAKSIIHNLGVLLVGFAFGFLGTRLDAAFGIEKFNSIFGTYLSYFLMLTGFLIRVWAAFYFYKEKMKVIVLQPQRKLITEGAYGFSRNPLYLGGNVFIFGGAALYYGSPAGVGLTVLNIIAVDFMIRREERQLARTFGEEWETYKRRVRRWL